MRRDEVVVKMMMILYVNNIWFHILSIYPLYQYLTLFRNIVLIVTTVVYSLTYGRIRWWYPSSLFYIAIAYQ